VREELDASSGQRNGEHCRVFLLVTDVPLRVIELPDCNLMQHPLLGRQAVDVVCRT